MGSDFDARWMSIDQPTAGAADMVKISVTENQGQKLRVVMKPNCQIYGETMVNVQPSRKYVEVE